MAAESMSGWLPKGDAFGDALVLDFYYGLNGEQGRALQEGEGVGFVHTSHLDNSSLHASRVLRASDKPGYSRQS